MQNHKQDRYMKDTSIHPFLHTTSHFVPHHYFPEINGTSDLGLFKPAGHRIVDQPRHKYASDACYGERIVSWRLGREGDMVRLNSKNQYSIKKQCRCCPEKNADKK